jgi:diaminopimelate epimerase
MAGAAGSTFVGQSFESEGRTWTATAVSMGNPHLVLMLEPGDELESLDLERLGSAIETRREFPSRTNVEFVKVVDDSIHMRVWERGVGETAACGTGACAALVACSLSGASAREADVVLPGGTLGIEWRTDDRVLMTGTATWVFDGGLSDAWLASVEPARTVPAQVPEPAGAAR